MDKHFFGTTDTGKVRDNNEDAFIAEKIAGTALIMGCVIDGVGGYSGGEIASAIARKSILQHLNLPNADLPALMREAIIAADQQIMNEKQLVKEHEKMACVLTLVVADPERNLFHYAHVGDTRLYLLRDQSLVKITKDQSFVGFMEDSGRLSEEQAMKHPKRNEINKALGFGANIKGQSDYIETGQSPFLPGDVLLICSDGLSDMVNREQITSVMTINASLQEKALKLTEMANANGGLDNITVVLIENDRKSALHEPEKPKTRLTRKPAASQVPEKEAVQPAITGTNHPANHDKGKKGTITLLVVICLALLGANAYLLWRNRSNERKALSSQRLSQIKPPRNPQEKKLQDTLNRMTGKILVLTDSLFQSPILITEPLRFRGDTVYLIAEKGITLKRDTSFNEVPIEVLPSNQHLQLENLTFEDFPTAIASQNNAVILKNVRFVNCPNAMEIVYHFPQGQYVSGKLPKSTFKTDSLPVTVTP